MSKPNAELRDAERRAYLHAAKVGRSLHVREVFGGPCRRERDRFHDGIETLAVNAQLFERLAEGVLVAYFATVRQLNAD